MKKAISAAAGLVLGVIAAGAVAAPPKHAPHPAAKGPPLCAMLSFRALPAGGSDGEQEAGFYRSRFGTLALHAEVKQGQPADYFVLADGKRLADAPAALPVWATDCTVKKNMPKPETAAASCAGQKFRVVLAHDANERLALLYGFDGSTWRYCRTGSY